MNGPFFIGIDIGTQGARVVLMDSEGAVAGSRQTDFPLSAASREEQSPDLWWDVCFGLLKDLFRDVKNEIDVAAVKAVSVTSTSGTVIPLDEKNKPLHNAIMYSDPRSAEEASICKKTAERFNGHGYTGFNSSSGLSKMVWFVNRFPEKAAKLKKWIHAADFIIGKLSGRYDVTDYTNALKSGFDVDKKCWPDYLHEELPLKKTWLQEVVPSGTVIGTVETAIARELGISPSVQAVAGMTDGCASQIASGAVNPGDWNTTIGTTLVVKGVTTQEVKDPEGRLYCHRHPEGFWMPGGAGNIGADWVSQLFKDEVESLSKQAEGLYPTGHIAYPLLQQGERFPFFSPEARGFAPAELSRAALFTAYLEGVAFVERYAYEMIESLSGESVSAVFTAGGASNSDVWLSIRSNVLNRPVRKMQNVSGAAGAAILAASSHFGSLREASRAMTRIEKEIRPKAEFVDQYNFSYKKFVNTLREKGYLREGQYA